MSLMPRVHAVLDWLPNGSALPAREWEARHRIVTAALFAQLPLVFGYGLITGHSIGHSFVEMLAPGAMALVAWRARGRTSRASAGVLGLMLTSATFVHLSSGLIEWHFHFFVMLALVSLYQEWQIYLIALGFVVAEHILGGLLAFHAVYNHGAGEWWWGVVHGAFVLAASAFHVTSWRFQEAATARAVALQAQLTDGERSLLARTDRIAATRSDLIAVASHEFRTPITAIKAAASVLEQYGDRLSPAEVAELVSGITGRTESLAMTLDNMLLAARLEPSAPDSRAAVDSVMRDAVVELSDRVPGLTVVAEIASDVTVRCEREPLHLMLTRLIEGLMPHGAGEAEVAISVRSTTELACIEASVRAAALDAHTAGELLEAFTPTSEGHQAVDSGLRLFAARGIAELHGGSMTAALRGTDLVICATLPLAATPSDVGALIPVTRAEVSPPLSAATG